MVRDVSADATAGIVVLGWRSDGDGLHLRVRGQDEEIRLRCRCERSHWIVREQFLPQGAQLLASCHTCGRRWSYVLEGAHLPAR